jgi:16S rRNA A1518/A1519 N6-dimethyltransferase RsmA/KsgA/DIM1 with predicted DNA glycosylase/AP lyase activity
MKKNYIFFIPILAVLFTFLSPNPSSAILGLSKCEKVKKEIKKYESEFNLFANQLYRYRNKTLNGNVKTAYDNFINSDRLSLIWKTAYNNQKCLTNTQKDYLPILKKLSPLDFVEIDQGIYTKNTKKCKKTIAFLDPECRYVEDDKIKNAYVFGSIFDK